MKIEKSKINNVDSYLKLLETNQTFYISLKDLSRKKSELRAIGYSEEFGIGKEFLPHSIGKVSEFNSQGKTLVEKDKDKINQYKDTEVTDWHGNRRRTKARYLGYPKKKIPAPTIKFKVEEIEGEKILISPKLVNTIDETNSIKHIINLFLEVFKECEILNENFQPIVSNIKKLSWRILPKGEQIWEKIEYQLENIVSSRSISTQEKVEIFSRIKKLTNSEKDFIALGDNGFNGYLIFGFEKKGIFILESVYKDNATYVFGNNWEKLSKLSKAEVIKGNEHLERIIHNNSWITRINDWIN